MTGKVAGTLAIPTVTPFFDSMDQMGSSFSILVLAVIPPTMKPLTPCSSGLVLVNSVLYTRGQFGAETVRKWREALFLIRLRGWAFCPAATAVELRPIPSRSHRSPPPEASV